MTTERRTVSPRVTYEEARPVLESLVAAGKARPSAVDLYNALKRGGFTTLQKHVDRFREEKPRTTKALVMSQEAQEFYLRDMQRQVDEARREVEAELAEVKQEKAKALEESERLETEVEEISSRHEAASSQLQQKLGVIDQLQTEITRLREQEDSIREGARQQIAAAQEAAAKEIRLAQEAADGFRREAETAKTEAALLQAKLEAMGGLEEENVRLRTAMKTLEGKIQQAEREAAVSNERASSLGERLTDLQKTLSERLPKIEEENGRLLKALDAQKTLLQKAEQASALAEEKARNMEQRLQDTQVQTKGMQDLLEAALKETKEQILALGKNAEVDRNRMDALLTSEAEERRMRGEAEEKVKILEERIRQLSPSDPKKR